MTLARNLDEIWDTTLFLAERLRGELVNEPVSAGSTSAGAKNYVKIEGIGRFLEKRIPGLFLAIDFNRFSK